MRKRKLYILLSVVVGQVLLLTLIIDLLLVSCLSSAIILLLLLCTTICLLFGSLFGDTHSLLCIISWSVAPWDYRVIRITLLFLRFFQISRPHYRSSLLHFFNNWRI